VQCAHTEHHGSAMMAPTEQLRTGWPQNVLAVALHCKGGWWYTIVLKVIQRLQVVKQELLARMPQVLEYTKSCTQCLC
jgi:hypothetical protein